MEIKFENELGKVEKHEVSEEFMDLCIQQAKQIVLDVDDITNLTIKMICYINSARVI